MAVCLTFPSKAAASGDPYGWYGPVPISTDFAPDTLTLQACS